MEWPLLRSAIIGIAVAGGIASVLAMLLQNKPGRALLARRLNIAAYVLMAMSMLFFIFAGLRGPNG